MPGMCHLKNPQDCSLKEIFTAVIKMEIWLDKVIRKCVFFFSLSLHTEAVMNFLLVRRINVE